MAFLTLKEDKKKARTKLMALVIGVVMLYVGWQMLVMDLATTAAFWDALGLQKVIPNTGFHPFGFSTEGWIISIFLSGFQIFASYKIAHATSQSAQWRTWVILRLLSAIVDTYTDISYRSYSFASLDKSVASFVISVIAFNIGSEWAITAGFGLVADNFAAAFPFLAELWNVLKDAFKFMKSILATAPSGNEKPKSGGGGDGGGFKQGPERASFSDIKRPPTHRPNDAKFTPTGNGGVNPKELAEKKIRGQMGDDEFFASLKGLPPALRRAVMAELPPVERDRLEDKMRKEMTQMNSPFGGGMS